MDKFEAVLNNGKDVNISMISGCDSHSMDWCEKNCKKYHDCHTIAMANDLLKEYEESKDAVRIKRNMYARTKEGFIVKLNIPTFRRNKKSWTYKGFASMDTVDEDSIVKTSFDVIDLIDVGDFVNDKKVLTVIEEGFMNEDCDVVLRDEVKDVVPVAVLEALKIKAKE